MYLNYSSSEGASPQPKVQTPETDVNSKNSFNAELKSVTKLGISDVTFCIEASKRVSSNGGGVSAKRVSRLASFMGGVENDDVRSLAAWLYHVTGS